MTKHIHSLALGLSLVTAGTAPAQSFSPVLNTNSYPQGSYSTITVGNAHDDNTAVFRASGPDDFLCINYFPAGAFAANINGAAFFNQTSGDALDIQFAAPITAFQINWVANATAGETVMDLSAYFGGNLVGKATSSASHPLMYDEGAMAYSNPDGFDHLVVGLDSTVGAGLATGQWAMGTDVAGTGNFGDVTRVPEPSTLALSMMGGLGSLLLFRRRK
jgi:hypothetical protein